MSAGRTADMNQALSDAFRLRREELLARRRRIAALLEVAKNDLRDERFVPAHAVLVLADSTGSWSQMRVLTAGCDMAVAVGLLDLAKMELYTNGSAEHVDPGSAVAPDEDAE